METNRKVASFIYAAGVLLVSTVTVVGASTSLPSSSSEVCVDEKATCYDENSCWDCVSQTVDISSCEESYSILLDDSASDCEILSAEFCCGFDMSSEDCLEDTVTMDYIECSLEDSGCSLPDSPCTFGIPTGDVLTPAPPPLSSGLICMLNLTPPFDQFTLAPIDPTPSAPVDLITSVPGYSSSSSSDDTPAPTTDDSPSNEQDSSSTPALVGGSFKSSSEDKTSLNDDSLADDWMGDESSDNDPVDDDPVDDDPNAGDSDELDKADSGALSINRLSNTLCSCIGLGFLVAVGIVA